MPNLTQESEMTVMRSRTDWGAVWAGAFTFIAIWSVFGFLGWAIFASSRGTSAGTGMNVGMAIWAVVLTVIAMYIAGRETGRLAAVTNPHDGLIHGMVMFGLAVVATLVIAIFAGNTLAARDSMTGVMHNPYLSDMFAGLGWAGFLSLFLGWLAAMGGAATGASRRTEATNNVRQIRPAA